MTSVLEPILEKGILDHSIIHKALMEYLTIADEVFHKPYSLMGAAEITCYIAFWTPILNHILVKSSAAEIIKQVSGPILVRAIHTKDGSRIGILCIKHGNAKVGASKRKFLSSHISWIILLMLVSFMCFRRGRRSLKEWKIRWTRLHEIGGGVWYAYMSLFFV